jgi:uncharacterized damage-inducible protein DinB
MSTISPAKPAMTSRSSRPSARDVAAPLVNAMNQLAEVIGACTDTQYITDPVGSFACSLGSQVRHCLDHVRSLIQAARTGWLDFDARERGTEVETSRVAAMNLINSLTLELADARLAALHKPLRMTTLVESGAEPWTVSTTLGREIAFVISHTIHHAATIAAMAKYMNIGVSATVGCAPSTLAYRQSQVSVPCAQ